MFFCCFSVKTKTRIPVKSKAFYPSSGKNDQGGIYILYIDLSKNCCSRNYVHTNVFYCTIPSNLYFVMVVFCFLVLKLPGSVSEEIKNNMFITCTSNLSINISQWHGLLHEVERNFC